MEMYYGYLLKRLWIILLAAALVAGATFFFYQSSSIPMYSASSSMYITRVSVDSRGMETTTYNDLLSAELVATDCKSIIPSIHVLGEAADALDMDYAALRGSLSVSSGSTARTIVISYTDKNSETAVRIVDEVRRVFVEKVPEFFLNTTVERLNNTSVSPVGSQALFYALGAGALAACFVTAVFLIAARLSQRSSSRAHARSTRAR